MSASRPSSCSLAPYPLPLQLILVACIYAGIRFASLTPRNKVAGGRKRGGERKEKKGSAEFLTFTCLRVPTGGYLLPGMSFLGYLGLFLVSILGALFLVTLFFATAWYLPTRYCL
eukprot:93727-Rhodomonas_salina.1